MPARENDLFSAIKTTAVERMSWTAARSTNLYIEKRVLKREETLMAYNKRIPLATDTIMVFADEAPLFNWAHPCRYLLHDAKNGELYQEVKAQFPPYLREISRTFEPFHEPVRLPKEELLWPIRPKLRCPIRWLRGNRYAVLFSGASNNRHTNDLEFLYRTLRDIYNFSAENIFVLNYDGKINYSGGPKPVGNWPGDNTPYRMPVNAKGTKTDLEAVLDNLKTKLQEEDLLLIHTNNHGGHNGAESYLCTFSGPDYLASEFAAKLHTLPKFKFLMVSMEQCHSGGFNAPILAQSPATHTTISSACEELRNSIGGAEFDPFARDWISAIAGHTPTGGALASNPDIDGSGKVSAREAHNYADSIHHPYDTPVYNESSVTAGDCHFGQRYSYFSPILCRLLVDALKPHYVRKPIPEFYRLTYDKLQPQITELEQKLNKTTLKQQEDLRVAVEETVKKIF